MQGPLCRWKGLGPRRRMVQRAIDVDQHDVLAGLAEQPAQERHVAASDPGMQFQIDRIALPVEGQLAVAGKADGVAIQIDLVQRDVLSLDREVDIALGEGRGVGRLGPAEFSRATP